jgi:integrase
MESYHSYLRHFADEFSELPTDTETIERFLRVRKETPGHRGQVHRNLQAFYSWLASAENIPSPVPASGAMGRPRKGIARQFAPAADDVANSWQASNKVVWGGISLSQFTSISTSRACQDFLKRREVSGCTHETLRFYTSYLRRFALMFPSLPLDATKLDKFLSYPTWSSESRLGARRTLVALYHFLEETHKLPKDAVTVGRVKHEKKLRRILSREELGALWHHTQGPLEIAILNTLVDTKVRAGELVSMTRENIFPDHALVKGKVGERQVPLSDSTYRQLCELTSSGYLFTVEGRQMTQSYLYGIIHNLALRSGLTGKKLGPHIIRHTSATFHIVEGGSERALQQELGHTNPIMTAVYSHLAEGMVNTSHRKLNLLSKLQPADIRNAGSGGDSTPRSGLTAVELHESTPADNQPEIDFDEDFHVDIKTRTLA